jgi:hypothetical protein
LLSLAQRSGELWAFVQRVSTFSGLDLDKLTSGLQRLTGGKSGDGIPVGLKAETALALLVGGNTINSTKL